MSDHPDLEKLDPSVREIVREVFCDAANGKPDNITRTGCLALASKGHQAWNAWRDNFPPRSSQVVGSYLNNADFSEHRFVHKQTIDFSNFKFGKGASFSQTKFYFRQSFKNSSFDDDTSFEGAVFQECADFERCIFYDVSFEKAIYKKLAYFTNCKFNGYTHFNGAEFEGLFFRGSVFFKDVEFIDTQFKGSTNFGTEQENGVVFYARALFHGAKISQLVSFQFASFRSKNVGDPHVAESYRALKLEYSKQHAIKEENRFFKLEMAEETARAKGFERYLYRKYAKFSDYGFSVSKPIRLFAETLIIYLLLYGLLTIPNCKPQYCEFSFAWIEFTLVQALPLPGLDKLSDTLRDVLYPKTGGLSILLTIAVIMHKAFSLLALFLLGLGLRNLFKLK